MNLEVQMLPVADIVADDTKIRECKPESDNFKRFLYSIEQKGVRDPIKVTTHTPPKIIDGNNRLKACSILGIKQIPAIVCTGDEDENRQLQLILNRNRIPQTKSEERQSIKIYMNGHPDFPRPQIAKLFAMSESELSQILGLDRLTPEAETAFDKGEINYSKAIELAKLHTSDQQGEVANAIAMSTTDWSQHCKNLRAARKGDSVPGGILRSKTQIEKKLAEYTHRIETTSTEGEDYVLHTGYKQGLEWSLQLDPLSSAEKEAGKAGKDAEKSVKALVTKKEKAQQLLQEIDSQIEAQEQLVQSI